MRDSHPEHRRATGGFTLIELLVTIVVLSILLGLAVPAFRSLMQNDQQWVQQNNLVLSLNAARSEAIKNDMPGGCRCAAAPMAPPARIPPGIRAGSCCRARTPSGQVLLNPSRWLEPSRQARRSRKSTAT